MKGWVRSDAGQGPSLTVVCDLAGTLLPGPRKVDGVLVNPTLADGAAQEPLARLLSLGVTVVGVTGSKLSSHKPR